MLERGAFDESDYNSEEEPSFYGCEEDCACRCHEDYLQPHDPDRFLNFFYQKDENGNIPDKPEDFYIENENG